jgi:hypothetical protein
METNARKLLKAIDLDSYILAVEDRNGLEGCESTRHNGGATSLKVGCGYWGDQ